MDVLAKALGDSTSLLESLTGSSANQEGAIDEQIAENLAALAEPSAPAIPFMEPEVLTLSGGHEMAFPHDPGPMAKIGVSPTGPSHKAEERGAPEAVMFILMRDGAVLMEKCPDKAKQFPGGEWFITGGRIERGETQLEALVREMAEELGCEPRSSRPLPLVDATGHNAPRFLMRPFAIEEWNGDVPTHVLDHPDVPLKWVPIEEARRSPVGAVRAALALAIPETDPSSPLPGEERCDQCGTRSCSCSPRTIGRKT